MSKLEELEKFITLLWENDEDFRVSIYNNIILKLDELKASEGEWISFENDLPENGREIWVNRIMNKRMIGECNVVQQWTWYAGEELNLKINNVTIGEWSDTWSWCFHFPKVKRGEFRHEETIKCCSTECQEKYNKSKVKELASTRKVDLKHNK
jgi:hypothetical protein